MGYLDPVSPDGKADQRAFAVLAHLSHQRLQGAGSRNHPEGAALHLDQHHYGAIGLEKSGRILGDLIHHPVQLNGLGEDVAELLKREQLADAPVHLDGELIGFGFGIARAVAGAKDGNPKGDEDADDGQEGEPPHPILRPPGHHAKQDGRGKMEGKLPGFAPAGKQQQRGRCAEPESRDQRWGGDRGRDGGAERSCPRVRGRDVGSFVEEAKRALNQRVQLPSGYYVEWSGQYENQISAKKRLELVIPVVFLIIFLLLYKTYNSFKEASHVILAVPFALSGGVFLLKLLGYNFSVAVWVGFIALFGTAVQTGVVMVIYLEEAVERKRAAMGGLTVQGLHEAVMEGALLRLRPKIMTVSTVVAGLLPIMWSTRTGAEVMKPLATPVLGGMVSSLLHVLIVTPVIFTWLRERELSRKETPSAA